MKITQRIISLLLAAVMLVGMVPPLPVAAEETDVEMFEIVETADTDVVWENEPIEFVETTEAVTELVVSEEFAVEEKVEDLSVNASPTSGTCGDGLTWALEDGTLTISGEGKMADYADLAYCPWYSYSTYITTIIINDGVTAIGAHAFNNCNNLQQVSLSDSVISIGASAFDHCFGLVEIELPVNLEEIGDAAFAYCSSLTKIDIPNKVIKINNSTFNQCTSLESVKLPNDLQTIGDSAFYNCNEISAIQIPQNVWSIGSNAFFNNGFSDIVLDGVASIGECAFLNCYSLRYISLSVNLSSIGDWAFVGTNLSDIYYEGSNEQWNKIVINDSDDKLLDVTVHFNNGYFSGGIGSKGNPYQVANAEQLNAVRHDMSAHYVQTEDIDLKGVEWNPIGSCSVPSDENRWTSQINAFTGSYNGNGLKISNLSISEITSNNISLGLFSVNEGTLCNINLDAMLIVINTTYDVNNGTPKIGGLAGKNSGDVFGCTTSGSITVSGETNANIGGIIGEGNCIDCINYASITGNGIYDDPNSNNDYCQIACGGIVGYANGEIRNCVNYGNVSSSADGFSLSGGISGTDGTISYCVNFGNVSSNSLAFEVLTSNQYQSNAGGIAGTTSAKLTEYCVNLGNVSAVRSCEDSGCCAGGITGYLGGFDPSTLSHCYNLGSSIHADQTYPESPEVYVGAIHGNPYDASYVKECYTIDTVSITDEGKILGGNGNAMSGENINLAIRDIFKKLNLPWQGSTEQFSIKLSSAENMTVKVGYSLEIACQLYNGDKLITDWEHPTVSFGNLSEGGKIHYVGWEKTENGYVLTLEGVSPGMVYLTIKDSKSETLVEVPIEVLALDENTPRTIKYFDGLVNQEKSAEVYWGARLFAEDADKIATSDFASYAELVKISALLAINTYDISKNGYLYKMLNELGVVSSDIEMHEGGSVANPAHTFSTAYFQTSENTVTPIVIITIRGSSNWQDAKTDLMAYTISESEGSLKKHQGFSMASDLLKQELQEYITQSGIDSSDAKILITGHSYGAAVANLLAASIEDIIDPCRIYAYTFAAPNTIVISHTLITQSNIHNFRNAWDPVVHIPFATLPIEKYTVFGENHYFILEEIEDDSEGALVWRNHNAAHYVNYAVNLASYAAIKAFPVKYVRVRCPVDVEVSDDTGVIGRISNNVLDESITKLMMYPNEDEKIIYIPQDEDVRISIVAIDAGIMAVEICDCDLITGEITAVKEYRDVKLTNEKSFALDIRNNISVENTILEVVDNGGNRIAIVSEDGSEKVDVSDSHEHLLIIQEAKEATCIESGITEGKYCSVCNQVVVKQEVIPANGHTEEKETAKAPTCTEAGLTEGKYCSVCDVVLVTQDSVPAKGHTWDQGKITLAPTEGAEGIKTYTCTVCGEKKTDSIPKLEPKPTEPAIIGTYTTDLVMAAADLGVNASDSVLRATLTFTNDGKANTTWEAVDLTAFRLFFRDMFVNSYYAMAYGIGITDINEIEQFCLNSTGMSVSAYMDTIVTSEAIEAAFTPAPTSGSYKLSDDQSAMYTDMAIMDVQSNPEIANSFVIGDGTMYLNAASYGKPDYTFVCTQVK